VISASTERKAERAIFGRLPGLAPCTHLLPERFELGLSGQPYVLDLGDGMLVLVGAKRESFPDGSRFEGVGVR
jgi:hypothetical protein